jgi:hypothetical protein
MSNLTEPLASITMPGEQNSGLWLWHGAPPNEIKQHQTSARRVGWLVIAGVLLVTALLSLAGLILGMPKHRSPAEVAVSSPATPTSNPPSPPAIEAAQPPPVGATEPPHVAAIGPGNPTPEAVQRRDPTAETKQSPVSASAAPISSQGSRPVGARPSVARHHRYYRERAKKPLTQLFASPAFRKGTLMPVPDR